ncbi:hypothetical protein ACSMX9_12800 [Streptomyces sp. LE64]|uniref:hypothetical protein n=1 Tax=Streptomyces sp. LE64 TaxID=3448653 RepID=UPI0040424D34
MTTNDRTARHLDTAIDAIIDELATIADPVERQNAALHVLDTLLPAAKDRVRAMRAEAVAELREGRTLAAVGQLLGGISATRVDQILNPGRKKR